MSGALFALTLGAWTLVDRSSVTGGTVPWWAFAVAFVLVEVLVVHIHVRRDAYSFSLAEVPLVVGLLHATPAALVVGQLVGTTLALVLHRRQPVIKVLFNVANFAASTTTAVILFDIVAANRDPYAPSGWVAVFVATVGAAVMNVALIGVAMSLVDGRVHVAKLAQVNAFGLVVAIANTSLALVAVLLVRTEPLAAGLLVVIGITLLVAYRAYASERRHHESLEFLYQSTQALAQRSELGAAVVTLLTNACAAFRSSIGELILLPQAGSGAAALTRVRSGGEADTVMEVVSAAPGEPLWRLLERPLPASIVDIRTAPAAVRARMAELDVETAMVTMLQGEDRAVGFLLVGGRRNDVTPFNQSDLRLFETVANHAALSLENDQLETSVSKLLELERQLSHQAFHDAMTGLANRRQFTRYLDEVVSDRRLCSSVVLFVDLDDFKAVNDTRGHAVGDELLCVLARRLVDSLRDDDLVARIGGDEFAVLLRPDGRDADAVAARLVDAVRQPVLIAGDELRVTCSIGIATAEDAETSDELIRNADTAMYEAKAQGKGRHHRFTAQLYATVRERHDMQARIARAIEADEFEVYYQPIVALESGALVGAEALVRWQPPDGDIQSAGRFIDFAEGTGQSVAIGRFVIDRALTDAAELVGHCGPGFRVSVNVSGRQLGDTDVSADIRRALDRTGLAPDRLIVEITETAVMADIDSNLDHLHALRALGVQLALDDFGTGYSSLSHLRTFPIDVLKVAKPFLDSIEGPDADAVFLRLIVELGHSLGMEVIGEGVESHEQAALLRSVGCEYAQGFLYSPALPRPEFIERFDLKRNPVFLIA